MAADDFTDDQQRALDTARKSTQYAQETIDKSTRVRRQLQAYVGRPDSPGYSDRLAKVSGMLKGIPQEDVLDILHGSGDYGVRLAELESQMEQLERDRLNLIRLTQAIQHRQEGRPWMEALEMQYAAYGALHDSYHRAHGRPDIPSSIVESWGTELGVMKHADTYSWDPGPLAACEVAARTIPLDVRPYHMPIPGQGQAGWWYFPGPLPYVTTSGPEGIQAMLWGWVTVRDREDIHKFQTHRAMLISAFIVSREPMPSETADGAPRIRYVPTPTQTWVWYETETMGEMFDRVSQEYDQMIADKMRGTVAEGTTPLPKEPFMEATYAMARILAAGCTWMSKSVLHVDTGHIERHRRKQLARENSLDRPPSEVKIVRLRRVEYSRDPQLSPSDATQAEVEWNCRWVVRGHFRNQPHGPGRGERRLIWIDPFIKGPEDRPLKVPAATVYKVDR